MASGKPTVKSRLKNYLRAKGAETISEQDWMDLLERFSSASESYIRRILRESGAALAPLVEGVRQDTFENLERTLTGLEKEYSCAASVGDRRRCAVCRRLVIESKDHARWALRRAALDEEGKKDKQEMIEWMLMWLNDPAAFPAWVRLRKRARASGDTESSAP